MKRNTFGIAALLLFLFSSCAGGQNSSAPATDTAAIDSQLEQMSLRQKVGQLFYVRPEAVCPEFEASGKGWGGFSLQAVTEGMKERCRQYPVGGIVLFSHNIDNPDQLKAFTAAIHQLSGAPLVAVDEEGGRVARVANNSHFDVPSFASATEIGKSGKPALAYEKGNAIGKYLKEYGFDIDFAPVADVNTNPENIVIGDRAFSDDPQKAGPYVVQYLKGLEEAGIAGCLKHFPGHGDTKGDTHKSYVQTDKTWEEMLACEILPFKAGIQAGTPMVMTAHIAAPKVNGNDLPATLSPLLLTEKLRKELGFKGIIITDAMGMGAISQHYTSAQAAVGCLKAGADIVLMPEKLGEAFDAVVAAVQYGEIPEERIDQSVRRILSLKAQLR